MSLNQLNRSRTCVNASHLIVAAALANLNSPAHGDPSLATNVDYKLGKNADPETLTGENTVKPEVLLVDTIDNITASGLSALQQIDGVALQVHTTDPAKPACLGKKMADGDPTTVPLTEIEDVTRCLTGSKMRALVHRGQCAVNMANERVEATYKQLIELGAHTVAQTVPHRRMSVTALN